jgi:hypothetical protein
VRARILNGWWPDCTDPEIDFHQQLCARLLPITPESLKAAERWLLRLGTKNEVQPMHPADTWRTTLAVKWWETCRHFRPLGRTMLVRFISSPLRKKGAVSTPRLLRLLVEGLWPKMNDGGRK